VSVSPPIRAAHWLTLGPPELFKVDPNFLENEERYKQIKNEILGSEDEEEGSDDDSDDSDEEASESIC
jgi:pre-mRNA-splicing factor CWC22